MSSKRYDVELTTKARKDLQDLRPHQERILRELDKLSVLPLNGHPLNGSLRGARSLAFSLPNFGVCRAAYIVDHDDCVCIIFIVGPHENVYDRAISRFEALKRQR